MFNIIDHVIEVICPLFNDSDVSIAQQSKLKSQQVVWADTPLWRAVRGVSVGNRLKSAPGFHVTFVRF